MKKAVGKTEVTPAKILRQEKASGPVQNLMAVRGVGTGGLVNMGMEDV